MEEMKTKYDHFEVEKGKYDYWVEKGVFRWATSRKSLLLW